MNEETRIATTALRIAKLCNEIIEEIHGYEVETERRSECMQYTVAMDLRHAYDTAEQTLDVLAEDWCEMVCSGRVDWVQAVNESGMDEALGYCPWPVYEAYQRQATGPKWLH